jgi:hypothetical protein
MHSSMIGKLEKARRYADEPWRVALQSLSVAFKGDNDVHTVSAENGEWHCTCDFHTKNSTCAHVMAVQHMMDRTFSGAAIDHTAHLLHSR